MVEKYRFIPTATELNLLFERYEQQRLRLGLATRLVHVSPQQRIDTIVTILGLNAAGGWTRRANETASAFWLRYLRPVLAETRESVLALEAAVAGGLPGRFDPAIEGSQPSTLPVGGRRRYERPTELDPELWWRRQLALLLESLLAGARDWRVVASAAVVALAAIWGGSYYFSPPAPPPPPPPYIPDTVPTNGGGGGGGGGGVATDPGQDEPLDDAAKDYRAALRLTLSAAQSEADGLTPYELAEFYAGESGTIDNPAVFLSAMMRDWPLPPDQPIAQDRDGAYALSRYAATFTALERGDPFGVDRPAVDGLSTVDTELRSDLVAFARPGSGPSAAGSPPPTASWPTWPKWLFFLPLLALLVYLRWRRAFAFRALLVNPAAGAVGLQGNLPSETLTLTDPLPARRLARQISWRAPGIARRMNAPASIRRTIRNGGYFVVVPRLRRRTSDFLFLVPRLRDNDHEYDRVDRLIDSLRRGGLSIAAYDYFPDPRTLYARGPATDGKVAAGVLDLRAARELHAEARLVLVTDGAELVDYFSQRPLPVVKHVLATWPEKMLLTPTPIAEWGEREMNLSQALGATIGRAGPESFADLVVAFGERPHEPTRSVLAGRNAGHGSDSFVAAVLSWLRATEAVLAARPASVMRPRSVRLGDPKLLSDLPPPDQLQNALVAELRDWLGPLGFMWLAACAAYPQLRFAITVYLGLRLQVERGPVRERLYNEERLAQLTLLPWFRTGRMPPWLRRALFTALPKAHRVRIRSAVDDMLNGAGHDDLAPALASQLPIWRQDATGYDMPVDAVMADLMFQGRSEVDPIIKGGAFSKLFRDVLLRAQQMEVFILGAGLLWCVLAFLLFPDPGMAPEPAGNWLPLVAYLVATAVIGGVAGVLWFARRPLPPASGAPQP